MKGRDQKGSSILPKDVTSDCGGLGDRMDGDEIQRKGILGGIGRERVPSSCGDPQNSLGMVCCCCKGFFFFWGEIWFDGTIR